MGYSTNLQCVVPFLRDTTAIPWLNQYCHRKMFCLDTIDGVMGKLTSTKILLRKQLRPSQNLYKKIAFESVPIKSSRMSMGIVRGTSKYYFFKFFWHMLKFSSKLFLV